MGDGSKTLSRTLARTVADGTTGRRRDDGDGRWSWDWGGIRTRNGGPEGGPLHFVPHFVPHFVAQDYWTTGIGGLGSKGMERRNAEMER